MYRPVLIIQSQTLAIQRRETTEGTIKIDDTSYDYTAIVEQETDENGVVTKETLTLTVDEGYDNLGLWVVAYQDKTHLGDEKRFEIK